MTEYTFHQGIPVPVTLDLAKELARLTDITESEAGGMLATLADAGLCGMDAVTSARAFLATPAGEPIDSDGMRAAAILGKA
jgi:hypothetical protein